MLLTSCVVYLCSCCCVCVCVCVCPAVVDLLFNLDVFPCCLLSLAQFDTADPALPAASQAALSLEAVAYHSPNQRYLYIDPPLPGRGLEVGRFASIKVYSATPSYVPVKALSFLVRQHS